MVFSVWGASPKLPTLAKGEAPQTRNTKNHTLTKGEAPQTLYTKHHTREKTTLRAKARRVVFSLKSADFVQCYYIFAARLTFEACQRPRYRTFFNLLMYGTAEPLFGNYRRTGVRRYFSAIDWKMSGSMGSAFLRRAGEKPINLNTTQLQGYS